MAFTITVPDIHQGPGFLWYGVPEPAAGSRLLVDSNGNPVGLSAPAAPGLSQVAGGSLAATTYFVKTTYADAAGETLASTEASLAVSANNLLQVASPATVAGATGYNVYVSTTTGTETRQTTPAIALGTAWTEPTTGLTAGAALPAANTSGGFAMGSSEGAAKFQFKAKLEAVQIDQETAPVDVLMTAEDANIELSLKESSLAKIIKMLEHGTYTSGTDTGLPAGGQAYEAITVGGLVQLPTAPVALISPRRGTSNPTKYLTVCLYKAYGFAELDLSYTRTKESVYKVQFNGLADLTRTQGDRVAQFYRQT